MAEKFISEKNLRFLLYDVHRVEELTRYPYFADHSRETFDMVLDTAVKIGRDMLRPYLEAMDRNPPVWDNGTVRVNPMVREFMKEAGQGGWISAQASYDLGGQQLPLSITASGVFIFAAANYSASVYPMLTLGAAHLIESYGSEALKETYIPPMFEGRWQGTMALTEPQAGSSLSDVVTQAEPVDGQFYKIKGQKIFISAGEHDCVENVVHLMLARIKGAPAGVKGISLFVVPKLRPAGGGLEPNDLFCAGIFHKMGYRGAPITHLVMGDNDDCYGWLVGEPHKGLSYMFQMMNEARVEVGMGAASIASAAYYASLQYAKERPQGRRITSKDPTLPQIPIIEHADVKRMLLFQRAVVEGSLSLLFQCTKYSDLAKVVEGPDREKYCLLLDLLTPIAKTYPSEAGIQSVSQGLQILGGYGYCDEFPLEQYYRDMRIHPIHEGTTGIQGMDLLGRKVVMQNGRAFLLFIEELRATISEAHKDTVLEPFGHRLEEAREMLIEVTTHLGGIAGQGRIDLFLADATLYLELFSLVAVSWQWLLQGLAVQKAFEENASGAEATFLAGKLVAMKYFFLYELPKTLGLAERLLSTDGLTADATADTFAD